MKNTNPIRRRFLILLLGLVLVGAYHVYREQSSYRLEVFSAPSGWGYLILANGKPLIRQATIPGRAGAGGFGSEDQARRVGNKVLHKLRQGQFPPTVTPEELSALGVPLH